jgi:plasmid stabilization system protein ParE
MVAIDLTGQTLLDYVEERVEGREGFVFWIGHDGFLAVVWGDSSISTSLSTIPELAQTTSSIGLVKATEALRTSPDRGSNANKLRSLGISEYRQIFFKPYLLIYTVHSKQVIVYVVTDGRRDMGSLLARRLLCLTILGKLQARTAAQEKHPRLALCKWIYATSSRANIA